ncbi:hypothetical protein AB0H43_11265 [Hamadaea sp. NPDC050747]|uniref:hypothetical protein n=1 Tax=Hamadaea sp. NPDC050747 TaxID=3155789 RepID=UPI0033CFD096
MGENPLTPAELGEDPVAPDTANRPARRTWPIWVAIGVAAVLFLCCAGTATAGAVVWKMRHDDFTVTGDLTLADSGTKDGAVCSGNEMYGDITPGTQIVVSDAEGTVVAVGTLGEGISKGSDCVFPFTIEHVPKAQKFYGLTLGQRGTLTYTPKQLKEGLHLYL